MIKELDTVILTEDLPEHSLRRVDLGTAVLIHAAGGYEVEFVTLDGQTLSVVSLSPWTGWPVGQANQAMAPRNSRLATRTRPSFALLGSTRSDTGSLVLSRPVCSIASRTGHIM